MDKNYKKLMRMQQNIQMLEQYLQNIEQQAQELEMITNSLEEFSKVKKDTEILVPIVNGIFFKANLTDNSKFLVNIGAEGTVVEKRPEETINLIKEQLENTTQNHMVATKELQLLVNQLKNIEQ